MCGIAGVLSLKNDLLQEESVSSVKRMLSNIRHRGPDEEGIASDKDYIIGNARLNIVGGNYGKQPVHNLSSILVYNGEIYNYALLAKTNGITNKGSDTLALSELLSSRSIDILTELNGMFAFCYVTKKSIFLIRDRLGIKPLFYTFLNDSLYFASEMKAFLDIIDFKIHISDTFASLETETDGKTIFENIYQVEPGTYLKIDRDSKKIQKIRYYSLPRSIKSRAEKSLKEELRYLITDAVQLRIDTKKSLAAYVSGGIDSSIIALLSKPDYLFTYLPNSSLSVDEEKYADLLSAYLPESQLIKIKAKQENFLKNFIHMVFINEGPTTTFASYSQFVLSQEVKKTNVRIALSGIGADEFYNGYIRHAIAILESKFYTDTVFHTYDILLQKSGALHFVSLPKKEIYMNLLSRSTPLDEKARSNFLRLTDSYPSLLAAISATDSQYTLPPLLHIDDHINMAFHIESRSPFLDYRVVEFGMSLPEHYKIHSNHTTNSVQTKYLLREAFKDILPSKIYNRKEKIGFTSNVADLLRINMKFLVDISINILQSAFPDNRYFYRYNDSLGKFSRWEYQIVQLAITYLLFTKRNSEKDVYRYFKKNMPS